VVVFCGVNGVGKSTNLAKIAYWLGQHNIKVGARVHGAVCIPSYTLLLGP
jgi:signal recognition particle GTPase